MKKKILLFAFIIFSGVAFAQLVPPPFDPGAPPEPPSGGGGGGSNPNDNGPGAEGSGRNGVPLDGWEWVLLAGAGAYGIKKFKNEESLNF